MDEHYDKGIAAVRASSSYHYRSRYVEISTHKSDEGRKAIMTSLMPSRGHRVIKEGYDGIYYPRYFVELAV